MLRQQATLLAEAEEKREHDLEEQAAQHEQTIEDEVLDRVRQRTVRQNFLRDDDRKGKERPTG